MLTALAALVLGAAASVGGCTRRGSEADTGARGRSASATARPAEPLLQAIRDMAAQCEVGVREGIRLKRCPPRRRAMGMLSGRVKIDKLPLLAGALHDKDRKVAHAAAMIAKLGFRTVVDYARREPDAISPSTAKKLIGSLARLRGKWALRVTPLVARVAAHVALDDMLFAAVDKHPDGAALRILATRELAQYGRIRALGRLSKLAASKDKKLARAAVASVANMRKLTEAERAKVCPWARAFLASPDAGVCGAASRAMVRCGPKYVGALLDSLASHTKKGSVARQQLFAVRSLCQRVMSFKPPASDAQCERLMRLLEAVALSKKVDKSERGLALWTMGFVSPSAQTRAKLARYLKSKDKELARQARLGVLYIDRIGSRQGLRRGGKKKPAASSKSKGAKNAKAPPKKAAPKKKK